MNALHRRLEALEREHTPPRSSIVFSGGAAATVGSPCWLSLTAEDRARVGAGTKVLHIHSAGFPCEECDKGPCLQGEVYQE